MCDPDGVGGERGVSLSAGNLPGGRITSGYYFVCPRWGRFLIEYTLSLCTNFKQPSSNLNRRKESLSIHTVSGYF